MLRSILIIFSLTCLLAGCTNEQKSEELRPSEQVRVLGKVWGFLKYHHPKITQGDIDWDEALLEILPDIISAPDREKRNALILRWINDLGPVPACNPCAHEADDSIRMADLSWLEDTQLLGDELSNALLEIYANRVAGPKQAYLLASQNGYAKFTDDAYYELEKLSRSHRILTILRFWNIIEYWSPYRDLIKHDWDDKLSEYIERALTDEDPAAFRETLERFIVEIEDGHTRLRGGPPLPGKVTENCTIPVRMRMVEGISQWPVM